MESKVDHLQNVLNNLSSDYERLVAEHFHCKKEIESLKKELSEIKTTQKNDSNPIAFVTNLSNFDC